MISQNGLYSKYWTGSNVCQTETKWPSVLQPRNIRSASTSGRSTPFGSQLSQETVKNRKRLESSMIVFRQHSWRPLSASVNSGTHRKEIVRGGSAGSRCSEIPAASQEEDSCRSQEENVSSESIQRPDSRTVTWSYQSRLTRVFYNPSTLITNAESRSNLEGNESSDKIEDLEYSDSCKFDSNHDDASQSRIDGDDESLRSTNENTTEIEEDDNQNDDNQNEIISHKTIKEAAISESEPGYQDELSRMKDPISFEFEVSRSSPLPPYEFQSFLRDEIKGINFKVLALENRDWRVVPEVMKTEITESEEYVFDRILKLEKLQIQTKQIERNKREVVQKSYREYRETVQQMRNSGVPASRIPSASGRSLASRRNQNCHSQCLQVACVGDCPLKEISRPKICLHCRQIYCVGNCSGTNYPDFERLASGESDLQSLFASFESSSNQKESLCQTCEKITKPNRSKSATARIHSMQIINNNNTILGKPWHQRATFSSSEHYSKRPPDYSRDFTLQQNSNSAEGLSRNKSEPGPVDIQRKSSSPNYSSFSGRNSVIAGKSYSSNRKVSLTGLSARAKSATFNKTRANIMMNRRVLKTKRPVSAF